MKQGKPISIVFVALLLGTAMAYGDYDPHPADINYSEDYRGQYHFSPKTEWMNDINGLMYLDGKYHMLYQWGEEVRHGGYATSPDLLHWTDEGVALIPQDSFLPDDAVRNVSGAQVYSGRGVVVSGETARKITGSTKEALVVFYDCKSPDMDALLADKREHDSSVWEDDSVELFLDPTNKRAEDGYRHIIVNSLGTTYEAKGGAGAADTSWNPKIKVKTKVGKKGWTLEMAVPLKSLVKDVKKFNRVWAVNFTRMAYLIEGNEDAAWSPTETQSSHVPSKFGCLWLDAGKVDNTKKKK